MAGYAQEAEALLERYESIAFADVHRTVLHLFPRSAGRVLDIGAGTGRDAAAFAALGHRVVAVEPTGELRSRATALHPSPLIEWLDDSLPELVVLRGREERFDLVMLTAVWMHLDAGERRRAMPKVASFLGPAGAMVMSLRHGPVPPGRRMFEVSAAETIGLAQNAGLRLELELRTASVQPQNAGVEWTRLAFLKPASD
ncbi:MAG: class I SAM-dependent methyltransferase [Stellaceae bacterium]